ncbi:unnamed protein product [Bursaphelenchus okinawaensis]|uniref:Pre-mRNA processing factor 4 (PRP4)-like domain-containing protein n=1 Tax=Bursaphelenchus okinawaensis TaxID=465554 RepID=A0A811LLC6_9BILA|nr:unnamed protein product [Bursaphelenchus okinawaensis]CAG9123826.1 unnamed protein product [Bursaphelenchus okinawaensis]
MSSRGSLADRVTVEKIRERGGDISEKEIRSAQTFDMSKIDNPEEQQLLAEFDRRRKARNLMIPTDDERVKYLLRKISEPICLFGEDILDRRERLRNFLSRLTDDQVFAILQDDDTEKHEAQDDAEIWYHNGPPELRIARVNIADYSLRKAQIRLERARVRAGRTPQEVALGKQEMHKTVSNISLFGSQVTGSNRTSYVDVSLDSNHAITSNWGGQVQIWSIPNCDNELTLNGHSDKVSCARFRPGAFKSVQPNEVNAASGDFGGNVLLWSLQDNKPVAKLEQHENRVNRVAFHPSGLYLGTTCHDKSWRLYDINTQQDLLFQEGHSDAVYDLAFHPDGSLALSGSLDSYGRVWDLRTGRCIMFLEGHLKDIYSVQWHPNGFVMVTGSGDNQCKTWDIRMRRQFYSIPAHMSNVTGISFDQEGDLMVTSSYDRTLKLWASSGWQLLRTLEGHHEQVTSVQMSPNNKWIVSGCADKTFKLWSTESTELDL